MRRRSLLTAALAAPALYSARAQAAWCPTGFRWDGDGCVRTYAPPKPGHQSFDWIRSRAEVMFNEYIGFKGPPTITNVGNVWNGLAQIANSQERDELTAAATWVGLGSAAGQAIGHFTRFGGSLGAAVGFGVGLAGYAWSASHVLIQSFVSTTGAYGTNFHLDGSSSFLQAWGAGGVGPFGICFPAFGNSGGGGGVCYLVRMY